MQISRHFVSLCASVVALFASSCCNQSHYVLIEGFAQGGTWSVTCKVHSGRQAQAIQKSIDSLLLEIDNSVSGYNRLSLLSRLNAGEDLPLDNHFLHNFNISRSMWEESGGAFDPSAGPLFDLWGFGFIAGEDASQRAVDSVMQFVGMNLFSLDTLPDHSVHLRRADTRCRLNFNALAQGYSCDAVGALLRCRGCSDFLVEIGGEILCSGRNPKGELWTIGVENPCEASGDSPEDAFRALKDTLRVTDCAVVTSGNYRKHSDKGGHIIDPRTGMPTKEILRSETVIVPCAESEFACAVADARATVKCIE